MDNFEMTDGQFERLWQLYNEGDPAFFMLPDYVQDAVKAREREYWEADFA